MADPIAGEAPARRLTARELTAVARIVMFDGRWPGYQTLAMTSSAQLDATAHRMLLRGGST